mgnify:CR=1 FL=1
MEKIPELYKFPTETDDFELPNHGTQEMVVYLLNLKFSGNDYVINKAIRNLPDADTEKLYNVIKDSDPRSKEAIINDVRPKLVFNLLANRICESCGYKTDVRKLSLCKDCGLAWYCNKSCQKKHWNTHKKRCCKKDGPLDEGYQRIALARQV